jgi:hypothetical protein
MTTEYPSLGLPNVCVSVFTARDFASCAYAGKNRSLLIQSMSQISLQFLLNGYPQLLEQPRKPEQQSSQLDTPLNPQLDTQSDARLKLQPQLIAQPTPATQTWGLEIVLNSLLPVLSAPITVAAQAAHDGAQTMLTQGAGLITKAGEISQNPQAFGFAFEHLQAIGFNINAALQQSDARAYQVPADGSTPLRAYPKT